MFEIINQKTKKIKSHFLNLFTNEKFVIFLLLLWVAISFFILGRYTYYNDYYLNKNLNNDLIFVEEKETDKLILIASKNGKYYYLPWCAGALRIKEENKVFFKNKEEAEEKGYRPSKACRGL